MKNTVDKDLLSEALKERLDKVAERDEIRERLSRIEEDPMGKEAGASALAGSMLSSAAGIMGKVWPWLAIGIPAAAGTGAGYTLAKMESPTEGDLNTVAKKVLAAKKNLARDDLKALVDEHGPEILDDQEDGRGVRLG